MKKNMLNILLITLFLFTASCSTDPEPIKFGTDECAHCRMTIMDNKFGAELITNKGKIYKFDAAECMVNFIKLGKVKESDINSYYVIDASKPAQLTNAEKAYYLISDKLASPMGADLSAYGNRTDAESYQKKYPGEIFDWETLLKKMNK